MKVIISGTRTYRNYEYLTERLLYLLGAHLNDLEIVTGDAKGADDLAQRFAQFYGHKLTIFRADWKIHGKSAGPRRNRQMAEYGDCLIAFWDVESRGTKNMIEEAKARNLPTRIVKIDSSADLRNK